MLPNGAWAEDLIGSRRPKKVSGGRRSPLALSQETELLSSGLFHGTYNRFLPINKLASGAQICLWATTASTRNLLVC